MTNEQLKVLLKNIVCRLESALSEADSNLEEDVPRNKIKEYIGPDHIPSFFSNNPDHWEYCDGTAIALNPLKEIIDDLKDQIDDLGK